MKKNFNLLLLRYYYYLLLVLLLLLRGVDSQILQSNGTECRLFTCIPFTDIRPGAPGNHANPGSYGYGSWPSEEALAKAAFSHLAAAEMARRDFNDRNPVLVPELASPLLSSCPLQIPDSSIYTDTGFSRKQVVDDALERDIQFGLKSRTKSLCSVVGPVETEAHQGLSAITESFAIPQIAYRTIQSQLSRTDLFPTFARVIPEGREFGKTLAKAVHRDIWLREYLAIIYEPDYGDQFESPLEDAEDVLENFFTITEEIEEGSDDSIYSALGEVVSEGYRTIMYIGDRFEILDDVARVADDLGLLGDGYFWIIAGDAVPPAVVATVREIPGTPLDKLLDGAAVFTNYDPFVYDATNPFWNHWRRNDAAFVDLAVSMQPRRLEDGSVFYNASASFFQNNDPAEYSSFIYDAVMTAGIAACRALASGTTHREEILQSSFTGASGPLRFRVGEDGEFTNSRSADTLTFGFHNVRPTDVGPDGKRGYNIALFATYREHDSPTGMFRDETKDGVWRLLPGEEFRFFGNTTNEPMPLRTVADANFLSEGVQKFGLAVVVLGIVSNLGSAGWIFYHRKERFVKAGQPEFLYMLCFGSILITVSLVFISFDENQGWSDRQLDYGCSTFPWLFVTGYLSMYSALVSKLWRLSKLLRLRRQVVKVTHVLGPFAVLILCSLIVLTTWQIEDPLKWKRDVVNRDPLETYGECQVEGNMLAYIIPLGVLILIVTFSTAVFAWKLKDVQSDLAESRWIFFGIFTHLQTWAVGIPVLVITDDASRDAFYIMKASLAFIFSTTMVAFVIWPKIFEWFRDTYLAGPAAPVVQISTKKGYGTRITGVDVGNVSGLQGFNSSKDIHVLSSAGPSAFQSKQPSSSLSNPLRFSNTSKDMEHSERAREIELQSRVATSSPPPSSTSKETVPDMEATAGSVEENEMEEGGGGDPTSS